MQQELKPGKLLNELGNLNESGYATSLVKKYCRTDIKSRKLRIKEWDYYCVINDNNAVCITVADNSYMSLVSVTVIDFKKPWEVTKSSLGFMPKGKLNLPSTSVTGDVIYDDKKCSFHFINEGNGKRRLVCSYKNFKDENDFRCDLYLEETNRDSMVIATPFKKDKHFYYNQKINLLKANGYAKIGDEMYDFNKNSFGVLDWGRGVWTYHNTWYWSSMNGLTTEGERIGFNLGYGFGDTSKASENMLFYNDVSCKLEDVKFDIPVNKKNKFDYLKPWKFRSKTGDISLTFTPIINRYSGSSIGIIKSIQNQVFGRFNGYFIIDGKTIYIDDIIGFAERVENRW